MRDWILDRWLPVGTPMKGTWGKTFFLEVSGPFQAKLGRFESSLMVRYWWLIFAWGYIKMPLDQYNERAGKWIHG